MNKRTTNHTRLFAIMTAAVCDYRPVDRLAQKFKKRNESRHVELAPTTDICATLGACKGTRVVVGFAMEDHDHHANAEAKLQRKGCDAMVLNGIFMDLRPPKYPSIFRPPINNLAEFIRKLLTSRLQL